MVRLFENKSINQVTKITLVFTALITIFITFILLLNTYYDHLDDLKKIEDDYIKSQKQSTKDETHRAIRYIKYKHNQLKKNKNLNIKDIQNQIVETIENMRDIRNGSGYVFIYTFDGINIADPILKHNAGKNLIKFQDPNGKYVIKDLIDISKQFNGGYVDYVWNKPTTNKLTDKISYAIAYEPFKWMVGTGFYLDDIQNVLKEKKLKYKKRITDYVVKLFLFAMMMFLITMAVSRSFTYFIQSDIENIKQTLKNVSINYDNVDIEQLKFKEFKHISYDINLMINQLKELNHNLEQKVENRTKELKQSEQFAHDLVESQDKFIKTAIHEINTPLSIIITNIDLYKLKYDENKYLQKIEAGSKIVHNIYNDLAYLIKKDRIEYKSQNLNFSEFLNFRLDFFDEIAIGNKLKFVKDIDEDIVINYNETQLQRICDNSLSNAIKYSYSDNNIVIRLKQKQKNCIILSIQNIGDTIKNPDKLFERFYREDEARGGFGLGLNIIKDICQSTNVDIQVDSKDNKTVFIYKFNLKEEDI